MKDMLFEPIRIAGLEVKNRIYLPAMHLNMAENFMVTDRIVDFYAERARGGAGLICAGFATVDELSGITTNIGAHDDKFIPGLARIAEAINGNGARSCVQLNHAGRYNYSFFLDGKRAVAPSAVYSNLTRETPRELTIDEIKTIVDRFARAALRVRKAGYDAVEILCGTGYLISAFLSPLTNKREDEYGGSFENRMRFGLDIIRAILAACGDDFPILVRMNGNDFMEDGMGRKELQAYAKKLVETGVDALCVNVGWHEARVPQIVPEVPRGIYAYLARGIKELVDVPVIASHRINDPGLARELIEDGMCDMVAMGRSLIADPYLPEKARTGREREIVHCIACAQGCFDHIFKLQIVECLCNPRAGHEKETAIEKAAVSKKVMVAGAGPAGMSAAVAAADRGHRVTVYEKGSSAGGQIDLAAAPPGREEFSMLATDLENQLAVRGVSLVLNREVDEALIEKEKPDFVILATGAVPAKPPIPGADLPHVVQAWDVLAGRARTGRRVVIIGGGAVGVETALFLAGKGTLSGDAVKFLLVNRAEKPEDLYDLALRGTKNIVLVEMLEKVGRDIGKSTRWGMLQSLERSGVKLMVAARAEEIIESGVRLQLGKRVEEIEADTVVLAAGAVSFNPLQKLLEAKSIPFTVVGDAKKVALAFDAVREGFAVGKAS
ncbi:MAG: FAD-dependent oxidoreductase [Pseudomonadota bacterium]